MEMYEKDAIKIAESYAVAMRTRNGKVNATKLEYSLVCLYARKREKLSIGRKCNRGILATLATLRNFFVLRRFAGSSRGGRVSACAVLVDPNSKSVSLNLSLSFEQPIGMHYQWF